MKMWSVTAFLAIALISVINAAIHNTSFHVFLKRSVPFYLVILVSLYILENSIISVSEKKADVALNNDHLKQKEKDFYEEDDFIPLDINKYASKTEGKKPKNKWFYPRG